MAIRNLARRLPPIAWRDAKIRESREISRRLRAEIARLKAAPQQQSWWAPSVEEAVPLVRASGLFDADWYRSQLRVDLAPGTDLLEHYLTVGAGVGLSPHVTFMPSYYLKAVKVLKPRSLEAIRTAPLLHYLTVGGRLDVSPHPVFDAAEYAEGHPASRSHRGGPLGAFLAGDDPEAVARGRDRREFLAAAREAAQTLRDTRGYTHLERDSAMFDFDAEDKLKAQLRTGTTLPDPAPLVSVVLPTKDRAVSVLAAIDSVVAQTYTRWQLLVVDDGSRDGTAEALAPYLSDERIVLITHEQSGGVAAARNSGLAAATGDYVAYLDSDNTWREDFLELIVRFMVRDGHRVAYAMSALIEEEGQSRALYRGMPFSRGAMKERNYIDCIVLVHERSLLDDIGTFDETLRRNVDWDLFIRLVDTTDFGFLPVIGTQYDVWENRTARITTDEPMMYRYLVRQRAMIDWTEQQAGVPDRAEDLASVVLVGTINAASLIESVDRLRETARGPVEVVVVDNGLADIDSVRLQFQFRDLDRVRYHRVPQQLTLEVARNVGATLTSGATLVFLPETAWCEPDWDRPLVAALEEHAVVQPVIVTDGGAVWAAGVSFLSNGRAVLPYRGFAGDAPEVRGTHHRDGVTANALAVRAADYIAVCGFDPLFVRHYTGAELSVRLTDHTGRPAASVGESVVALQSEPPTPTKANTLRAARDNDLRLQRLWDGRPGGLTGTVQQDGYAVSGFLRLSNTQLEATPLLVHDRPQRPLRWAIKIGPPTVARRTNWGDWHFALALRDSLERCGHQVTIDCKDEWYRPTAYLDDVVLVLRGVSVYEVNPGHTNVSWVISHPERVSAAEMAEYDLVFGASGRWCERVSSKLRQPVEVLLQCTDHRRFHPMEPDRRRAHRVLAVANARGMRPTVGAALEAGIVPAVYGVRWAGLLPEGAWQGAYVPNDELAAVYGSAGVVLNDHWEDMRDQGLLSNRLFDLTASNARVISDYLPEIPDVFDDVVLTYTSPEQLPGLVATHLEESPERRSARAAMGEHVRQVHTFDARAQNLSEHVLQARAAARVVAK